MANSLYLDANIYLSFYHLSNEDLEELEKLTLLTKSKEITLYLPEQTKNEFYRNRDSKIADALKRFDENKLNNIFPQITKDYVDEYKSMKEAIKIFEKCKQDILTKTKEDTARNNLRADKTIKILFHHATVIDTTAELVELSKRRFDLGNPPGKGTSYGDALNWESLLSVIEDFDNFFFISDDNDYYSKIDNQTFNSFLLKEWDDKKPLTNFKYYRSLSKFFKEKYPKINFANEEKKEHLINDLANSSSFANTRRTLWELKNYDDFTEKQLNDIVYAAVSNNQVYWIGEDSDINEILYNLIKDKLNLIEKDYIDDFKNKFPRKENENKGLPF